MSGDSLSKSHKDKIFIAKNNLKLNLIMNAALIACLGLVFFMNWYHYKAGTGKVRITRITT